MTAVAIAALTGLIGERKIIFGVADFTPVESDSKTIVKNLEVISENELDMSEMKCARHGIISLRSELPCLLGLRVRLVNEYTEGFWHRSRLKWLKN
jgi:hypothetical protein